MWAGMAYVMDNGSGVAPPEGVAMATIEEMTAEVLSGQKEEIRNIAANLRLWIRLGVKHVGAFTGLRSWIQILTHKVGDRYPSIEDRTVRPQLIMAIIAASIGGGQLPGDFEPILRDVTEREISEWRVRRGFGLLDGMQPGALGQPLLKPEAER